MATLLEMLTLSLRLQRKGFVKIDMVKKIPMQLVMTIFITKGYQQFRMSSSKIPSKPLTSYNYNTLNLNIKKPNQAQLVSLLVNHSMLVLKQIKYFATVNFSNDFASRSNGTAKAL
jgi:hypothetical protein